MLSVRVYLAQRISAVIMVPLVIGHLLVMIYAVQGGLDSSEILSRTRGSVGWALFYGLFVVAVSVHGAIGLGVIANEWLAIRGGPLRVITHLSGLVLLVLGSYAVYAVVT